MTPMFCLSRKNTVPPQGFWCECPLDPEVIVGGDYDDLISRCAKHLESVGIVPPVNLALLVQDSLCRRLAGYEGCIPCSQVKQTIGFMEIVRWVHAMWAFATNSGFQCVEQEEAERRAEICAACPNQISTSGCWGCKGIAGLLPAIAGARKTSRDSQLKACGVCGCFNQVSVHIPIDVQGSEGLNFPDWCWKNPNSQ